MGRYTKEMRLNKYEEYFNVEGSKPVTRACTKPPQRLSFSGSVRA